MGLGTWAQLSAQALRRLCGSPRPHALSTGPQHVNTDLGLDPFSDSPTRHTSSLQDVVSQGWHIRAPPAPDEPGPSNWQAQSCYDAQSKLSGATRALSPNLPLYSPERAEPRALQNISNLINERFWLSLTLVNDPFRPQQVDQQDDLYSPTTPLDLSNLDTADSTPVTSPMDIHPGDIPVGFASQVQTSIFSGKKRRDSPLGRSQSFDSLLLPDADVFQA